MSAQVKAGQADLVRAITLDERILTIRGQKVILDADMAVLYGVPTKALNQAVSRNKERFPADFAFLLTPQEKAEVVTNCDHLLRLKFSPVLPRAFTEHGALMAANIINSRRAVAMKRLRHPRLRQNARWTRCKHRHSQTPGGNR
jgi:hypothetical protein